MEMQRDPNIRPARETDLARIAEIEIFNYRLNFYPIFLADGFYFAELQVPDKMAEYRADLQNFWVYDDGVVKGFVRVEDREIKKLFVEPVLQGKGVGALLLRYATEELGADELWALEKNIRAIDFYRRHGFLPTGERMLEAETTEYLVRLRR